MFKPRAKKNYAPGDPILAKDLNKTARNANAGANSVSSSGVNGFISDDMQGSASSAANREVTLRAIQDIIPEWHEEAATVNVPGLLNACVQTYDEGTGKWEDQDGALVAVTTTMLPIEKDRQFRASFSKSANSFVPVSEEREEVVLVSSSVRNEDGYYDGFRMEYSVSTDGTKKLLKQREIYLIDADDYSLTVEDGPGLGN